MTALIVLALVVLCLIPVRRAKACTGVYVGKKVSRDGSTMIARTLDLHPLNTLMREEVTPRIEGVQGRHYTGRHGFSWPLPETTYRLISTPAVSSGRWGRFGSACLNERGLCVTGTVTAYIRPELRALDPEVQEGLCEEVVTELIALTCETAREGVELIGRIMREVGSDEQNIIMLADRREAWYVETYTGHQWAAVRMPEDQAAVFGNEFMLGAVDPADEGFLCSDRLFSLPEAAGLAVYDAAGRMDLFATYAGHAVDYANGRTWLGHRTFAPDATGDFVTGKRYGLFFTPERQLGPEDVMALFRHRFEGTPYSPDETGRRDWRVIGYEATCTSHVLCVYGRLPAEMCVVGWLSLANAEHSVYLPVSNLSNRLSEGFTRDSAPGDAPRYDPSLAAVRFKRLCALAEQDRRLYGAGVRGYWKEREEALLRAFPEVLARAEALYQKEPAQAQALLNDFICRAQEQALRDADRLFEELLWYVMGTTETFDYVYSYSTTRLTPKEVKPFSPSGVTPG